MKPPSIRAAVRAASGAAVLAAACAPPGDAPARDAGRRPAVEAAMQHYVRLTRLVNSDSVAAMYTPDGEMLQARAAPIRGRDAIRAFLKPFDGHAIVDTATSTTEQVEVFDSTAYLWGSYHQVTRLDGPPAAYNGRFVTRWRLEPDGNWRIARILMQPAP